MAPARRKASGRSAAATSAASRQWQVGDLVLAKMKGFPAWPAAVAEPEKWGYSSHKKKVLVHFFGTKQIAFCNHVDIEAFTEEKKKFLSSRRHGKGADFIRALDEITVIFDKSQKKLTDLASSIDDVTPSDSDNFDDSSCKSSVSPKATTQSHLLLIDDGGYKSDKVSPMEVDDHQDLDVVHEDPVGKVSILDELRQTPLGTATITPWGKRPRDTPSSTCVIQKRTPSLRRSRKSVKVDNVKLHQNAKVTISISKDISNSTQSDLDAAEPECAAGRKLLNKSNDVSVSHDIDRVTSNVEVFNGATHFVASDVGTNYSKFDQVEPINAPMDEQLIPCYQERNSVENEPCIQVEREIYCQNKSPNKKRTIGDLHSLCINGETKLHHGFPKCSSSSFNSCAKKNDLLLKVDGDEHLPLVKRARARMPEPAIEESRLDYVVACDNSDKEVSSSDGKGNTSLRGDTSAEACTRDSTTVSVSVNKVPPDDFILHKSTIKPCQFKGGLMDAESALPPSKRLHRALEAMSANAAEARDTDTETLIAVNMPEKCCIDSTSVSQLQMESLSTSPEELDHIKHNDSLEINNRFEVDPNTPELQVDSDCRESCLIENESNKHLNREEKSPVHEIVCVPAEKNVEIEVINDEAQVCLLEKCRSNIDISNGSKTESSPSLVGAVVSLLPTEKGCSVISDGHDTPFQHEKLGQKYLPSETITPRKDSVTEDGHKDSLSPCVANNVLPVTSVGLAGGITSESTKSSSSLNSINPSINMRHIVTETNQISIPKDLSFSPELTPMKVLIAAAQAKRLRSRSGSLSSNATDLRVSSERFLSPSSYTRGGSIDRQFIICEKSNVTSSRSPDCNVASRNFRQHAETSVHLPGPVVDKSSGCEADILFKSFKDQLCTLTRAKESIGRATRRALDCARCDIASEVVESIVLSLEKEPSMHRRVDMFFLVDSITRSCRSQAGTAGDIFISLFLPVLPRLISAAAPPGVAATENRRQCLKVLRLWMERKTFPESIIRRYVRELESICEPSLSNGFSRRPARTERALDDPVREMEGMLVDEYGSNTGFQLPGLLSSRVTNGDDEGSDADDKIFEAVTPERRHVIPRDSEYNVTIQKHKHILEDVDGELEMEDVAPSAETSICSSLDASGVEKSHPSIYQFSQHMSLPFAPPLPEERPPSPPPLPSSPPPLGLSCSVGQEQMASNPATNLTKSHHLSIENQFRHSVHHIPEGQNVNLKSESASSYVPVYRDFPTHLTPAVSSLGPCFYNPGPHSSTQSTLDTVSVGNGTCTGNPYFLQPPSAIISNQFSYVQSESQRPSVDTTQFGNEPHSGNCNGNQSPRTTLQHERCPYLENVDAPSNHLPHFRPCELSPVTSQSWSLPPRASNHAYSGHSSRPLGDPFTPMAGASMHWRSQ